MFGDSSPLRRSSRSINRRYIDPLWTLGADLLNEPGIQLIRLVVNDRQTGMCPSPPPCAVHPSTFSRNCIVGVNRCYLRLFEAGRSGTDAGAVHARQHRGSGAMNPTERDFNQGIVAERTFPRGIFGYRIVAFASQRRRRTGGYRHLVWKAELTFITHFWCQTIRIVDINNVNCWYQRFVLLISEPCAH